MQQISRGKFDRLPRTTAGFLPPVPLMDVGFAITCPLARHRRPQIQFLSIGSRVCSTLLSDLSSRFGPCASLSLRLHQTVKRTFTSKLSNMLGTQKQTARRSSRAVVTQGRYNAKLN